MVAKSGDLNLYGEIGERYLRIGAGCSLSLPNQILLILFIYLFIYFELVVVVGKY